MRFNLPIKMLILTASICLVSLSVVSPAKSQAPGGDIITVLKQILQRVDNLPQFMKAWTDTDDKTSPTLVGTFQQLGQLLPADLDTQIGMQATLNNYLLSNDGNNLNSINNGKALTGTPPTPEILKYGNDLVYSSLLGSPLYPKDPREKMDFAMNYIMNASGSNIWHEMPTGAFHGKPISKQRYQSVYNTIMAATTFNNYVLSAQYADKNQFNTLQKTLIQQASDPSAWFAQVATENLGLVFRQLLMYQSQVFVMLTQMVQLQKQMVSAQAINTAVAIANNQMNENSMTSFAKGEQPSF